MKPLPCPFKCVEGMAWIKPDGDITLTPPFKGDPGYPLKQTKCPHCRPIPESGMLTAGHVESAFRNGVKMTICELVLNDDVAAMLGEFVNKRESFFQDIEQAAFEEWQRQGGPCKPEAKP